MKPAAAHPSRLRGLVRSRWRALLLIVASLGAASAIAQTSPAAPSPGTLSEALRIIQGKRFVDLTHAFGPSTPVWSGFGPATMAAATEPKTLEPYTIEKHGFRSTYYSLVGQYGTHVDPPAHFRADGLTMDQIPLKDMILPLVVFDITPLLQTRPNHALGVADIQAWESRHGRVPRGAFAALRTDMHKDVESNPARFKRHPFPAWSLESVKFLFEQRGIVAIGHESLDTDATPGFDAETWVLKNNHYQIEVMANLDQVPPTGAVIVVTWPKVRHGLGFPARAFAILP